MPVSFVPGVEMFHCVLTGWLSFHPDFHDRNSQVQREMLQYMDTVSFKRILARYHVLTSAYSG